MLTVLNPANAFPVLRDIGGKIASDRWNQRVHSQQPGMSPCNPARQPIRRMPACHCVMAWARPAKVLFSDADDGDLESGILWHYHTLKTKLIKRLAPI